MRILLVEDDPRLRDVLVRALRESGQLVDATGDGEEGAALGMDPLYDAIVLDVVLPGMDGFTIVRSLREREVATPVLFLTARDTAEDVVAGLDMGADDYLRKPFDLNEDEGWAIVSVRDDGPGFSPDALQHGAQRFWREKRDDEGSGLGLSIVAESVKAFGGSLSLGNAFVAGAEVIVRFPLEWRPHA